MILVAGFLCVKFITDSISSLCDFRPRVEAGKHTLPGHKTPLDGLHLCGDFAFPGIGVPATAAGGAITANNLVSIRDHWKMLDKIRLPKK